jgi:hypothetical protein
MTVASERLCLSVIHDSVTGIRWEVTVKLSMNIRAAQPTARVPKVAIDNIFLGRWHSLLSRFYFIYFARPTSLYCAQYVYTATYLTPYRLHMNYRRYQIKLWMKYFYSNRERCEALTGYLLLGRRPGGGWANMWQWTECFTVFFSNRSTSCPSLFVFLALQPIGLYFPQPSSGL